MSALPSVPEVGTVYRDEETGRLAQVVEVRGETDVVVQWLNEVRQPKAFKLEVLRAEFEQRFQRED